MTKKETAGSVRGPVITSDEDQQKVGRVMKEMLEAGHVKMEPPHVIRMEEFYVGIDPGLGGAVTLENVRTGKVEIHPMPVIEGARTKGRKELDLAALRVLLCKDTCVIKLCAIEEQQIGGLDGKPSIKTNFYNFGMLIALLRLYRIPHVRPSPKDWKKALNIVASDTGKMVSVAYCRSRWPDLVLRHSDRCKVDNHNFADSRILCEYARIIDSK